MGQFVDLTGKRFGRWTVLGRAENVIDSGGATRVRWHCRCDCGTERDVAPLALKNGMSKSCGCLHSEIVKESGHKNKRHGMRHTRLYTVWSNMHDRCYNPNCKRFFRYGGRGIEVCEEWRGEDGFLNFYNWASKNGYQETLTIDRIDNDGDYCPDNCRWVSKKVQNNNRSTSRKIAVNGEEKTVAEWCDYLGLKRWIYKKNDEAIAEIIKERLKSQIG